MIAMFTYGVVWVHVLYYNKVFYELTTPPKCRIEMFSRIVVTVSCQRNIWFTPILIYFDYDSL